MANHWRTGPVPYVCKLCTNLKNASMAAMMDCIVYHAYRKMIWMLICEVSVLFACKEECSGLSIREICRCWIKRRLNVLNNSVQKETIFKLMRTLLTNMQKYASIKKFSVLYVKIKISIQKILKLILKNVQWC